MTASKAHLGRTRTALLRTSAARDRFGAIVLEWVARNGWDLPVPADYRETWTRLDAEYRAAGAAYDEARGVTRDRA